ncbi:hypothetical protein F4560_001119 [Saccharothrix ecbatanensis]|uniref:Uncharacterized protein n=1 Tax=Saccharothrix ecbatanensis TaxID=1105145 RepID=A0A7W9HG59_9PSEU|nr:hypothetical protein [Saccharothrix ecbatanensis]
MHGTDAGRRPFGRRGHFLGIGVRPFGLVTGVESQPGNVFAHALITNRDNSPNSVPANRGRMWLRRCESYVAAAVTPLTSCAA